MIPEFFSSRLFTPTWTVSSTLGLSQGHHLPSRLGRCGFKPLVAMLVDLGGVINNINYTTEAPLLLVKLLPLGRLS